MHDVIVIGAGPAGCRTAAQLARQGHSVLVLERLARPGGKTSCTGIIGRECADVFSIDDRVILKTVNSACLYSPSGIPLRVHRDVPQACILDRPAFDRSMAERAQQAGADIHFESRVTGIVTGSDSATVTFERNSQPHTLPSRAVVLACGYHPDLVASAGLDTFPDAVAGAQAEVDAPGLEEVEVFFGDVAPGFFSWLVPAGPGRARSGLLARRNAGPLLQRWLATLAARGKIASADVSLSYGGIPLRCPARSSGERLLAVGDAAAQVKPTSGGGIYYGLLAADIAAATLSDALKDDDLSARRLAAYERGWRHLLGRELRNGYRARRMFERLSGRSLDRIFTVLSTGGIPETLLRDERVTFDWHSRAIKGLLAPRVLFPMGIAAVKLLFKRSSN